MMPPQPYRVVERRMETADTVTLTLEPCQAGIDAWSAGQFTMVYAFGVGEVPISISGGAGADQRLIRHTVRDVGCVTHAIAATGIGGVLGLHGPYGRGWQLPDAGSDLVVVAGGIGLAPLRPLITQALAQPRRYPRVWVLVGARRPAELLYPGQYQHWRAAGARVLVTVDQAASEWAGPVGLVTTLLPEAGFAPERTTAYVCGPEPMMQFTAQALTALGVAEASVRVSLERNMRCGVARCGHCQLGSLLVCRDGPVVDWPVAAPLLSVKER